MRYNNINGKGIEITYVDGTTEHFDPITDWNETEETFSFYIGGHTYTFNTDDVVNIREYNLCDDCGYELYYDGCRRCYMEKELELIKKEQDDRT